MAGKMPVRIKNDLLVMDISSKLPCAQKDECAVASGSCDHFVSHECPVAGEAVFSPNFASCPFLGSGKTAQPLEQLTEIYCKDCHACEGEKPLKICAVCRRLHIGDQWTDQKFIGIQTTIPYVFCNKCRLQ